IREQISLRVLIHFFCRRGGSSFAKIDEVRVAAGKAQQHESAAADVSRLGMYYRQRKTNRHGGVHRVAASFQDFNAGSGSESVEASLGRQGESTRHWRRAFSNQESRRATAARTWICVVFSIGTPS